MLNAKARGEVVIEGYASLFGVEDLAGDVVRAGAFARSLRRGGAVGMLLQHAGGRTAGRWTAIREDGRGLFVRGLVTDETLAGRTALKLIGEDVMDGLSIGFLARDWSPRAGSAGSPWRRGRELREIELKEISLVTSPMLPGARFVIAGLAAAWRGGAGAWRFAYAPCRRKLAETCSWLTPGQPFRGGKGSVP